MAVRLRVIKQMMRTQVQLHATVQELMKEVAAVARDRQISPRGNVAHAKVAVQQKPSAQQVIAVIGSSGNVGLATLEALCKRFPAVHVRAGVRDVKSKKLADLRFENLSLMQASMADPGW